MREGDVAIELPAGWSEAAEALTDESETSPRLERVRGLGAAVGALNAISASLPTRYGWRFITAERFSENFTKSAAAGATVHELNGFYWRDTLATIEAYTIMSVWRMVDISQAAFRSMDAEAVVPCAILARSALESAVQFALDARTVTASLEEVMKHDLSKSMASSGELEAYLLKTVYASRQEGTEEIYKSRNILTVLGKIANLVKDEPIVAEYETLCEVTHPNFLGRSSYLTDVDADRPDGSELRTISPANGINSEPLLQSALWALSWAIGAQTFSTHLLQSAVADMVRLLPPRPAA